MYKNRYVNNQNYTHWEDNKPGSTLLCIETNLKMILVRHLSGELDRKCKWYTWVREILESWAGETLRGILICKSYPPIVEKACTSSLKYWRMQLPLSKGRERKQDWVSHTEEFVRSLGEDSRGKISSGRLWKNFEQSTSPSCLQARHLWLWTWDRWKVSIKE